MLYETNQLDKMENKILRVFASHYPFCFPDIQLTYLRLGKSFDKTLLALELAPSFNLTLYDTEVLLKNE